MRAQCPACFSAFKSASCPFFCCHNTMLPVCFIAKVKRIYRLVEMFLRSPSDGTASSKLFFFSSWYNCAKNTCKVASHSVNSFFVYKPFEVDESLTFFNMEKIEYRAVIRFFVLKGLKAKEILSNC